MKKLGVSLLFLFFGVINSWAVQEGGPGSANTDNIPLKLNITSNTVTSPKYGDVWIDGKSIMRFYNGTKNVDLNSESYSTYINEVSDIPNPLTDGYYIVNGDLVVGDGEEFVFGTEQTNIVIEGRGILYYTGSGTLFSGADIETLSVVVRNFTTVDLTGNGTLFDISSSSTSVIPPIYFMDTVSALNFGTVGYVNNITFGMSNVAFFGFGNGFYCESSPLLLFTGLLMLNTDNNSINHINISGECKNISITGGLSEPGSNEYTFNIHSTTTIETATINGFSVDTSTGGSVFNGGLDQTALGWQYSGNVGIPDSTVYTHEFYTGLSSTTVISGDNTPVPFVTTWTQDTQERVISFSTGTFVYTGKTSIKALVHAKVNIDPTSGAVTEWTTYIYHNGVVVPGSASNFEINVGGKLEFNSLGFIDILNENDTIEIWIERNSGSGDAVTSNGVLIIDKK
jgi:hypothetical protein